MNEIIKQAEPIALICDVKKAILLYERVFGSYPAADIGDLMYLYDIETQVEFEEVCNRIVEELYEKVQTATLSQENKDFLEELNYTSFIELACEGDFDLITSKYHCRKYFNEIPNELIVDTLITAFERIWEIDTEGPFYITVYDLADEPVFFSNYDDLCSFVHNYAVEPYVAFEIKNNKPEELPHV